MTTGRSFKCMMLLGSILAACGTSGAADLIGEADDGTPMRISVAGDEVSVEIGEEVWLEGAVVGGSFELVDESGLVVRGHLGPQVTGFFTRPNGDEVTFSLGGEAPAPAHAHDGVASETYAATSGSTCSCIWVFTTSHYHCTVNGATRCFGSCP